jgi:hypothetical protein
MKTLLIHPGMPKAGSTSIQSALAKTKSRGSSWNLLDFEFGGANSSVLLANYFSIHGAAPLTEVLRETVFRPEQMNTRVMAFKESDSEISVISAEGLWNWDEEELDRSIEFFSPRNIVIRPVLRDPWSASSSYFQQRLKAGKSDLKVPRLNYRAGLSKFEKYELHVTDLAPFRQSPDLRPLLPIRVFPELDLQQEPETRNRGISWPAAIFLFRLNSKMGNNSDFFLRGSHDRKKIVQTLRLIPGPKFILSPSDVPWADAEADYVRARFGMYWIPAPDNNSDYSLLDLASGMSKKDASLVRGIVTTRTDSLESTTLKAQLSAVLSDLEQDC